MEERNIDTKHNQKEELAFDPDVLAKKYLGKNFQSSIFIPPLKSILECTTYQDANKLSIIIIADI